MKNCYMIVFKTKKLGTKSTYIFLGELHSGPKEQSYLHLSPFNSWNYTKVPRDFCVIICGGKITFLPKGENASGPQNWKKSGLQQEILYLQLQISILITSFESLDFFNSEV